MLSFILFGNTAAIYDYIQKSVKNYKPSTNSIKIIKPAKKVVTDEPKKENIVNLKYDLNCNMNKVFDYLIGIKFGFLLVFTGLLFKIGNFY